MNASPTLAEQTAAVDAACDRFPAVFSLRAGRGERFRVSRAASYWTAIAGGGPMLYVQRLTEDGTWTDYAKGTPAELEREIVPVATLPTRELPLAHRPLA